jgi:molybdopterin-containing oxidoreductase family molybdopterin binding subunit
MTSSARTSNILGGTMFSYLALSGDAASPAAYYSMLGEFQRCNDIMDVENARYLVCAGKNVADTAHSEMHFIFDAMEKGCKLVVVDPRHSRSAAKADEWMAPRPGTDAAMVLGMIHTLVTERLFKRDYLLAHTNLPFLVDKQSKAFLRERDILSGGSDRYVVWDEAVGAPSSAETALRPALTGDWTLTGPSGESVSCHTGFDASWSVWRDYTPQKAEEISGVPAEQIRRVARDYATTEPAWIWLGFGGTRYQNGHLAARAWITLAALCGAIGKPYAGVNTYESGLTATMAGTPADYLAPDGRRGHPLPGTQLLDVIESGAPYPIKSLWMVAYGFGTQSPFLPRFVERSLPLLDLYVVNEQVMTASAQYADFVLPCVSYYEDDWDLVGSGESWNVQLRRRAVSPVGESRSDYEIFAGLCEQLGFGEYWRESGEEVCRRLIKGNTDPRVAAVDWDRLVEDGVALIPIERPHVPFKDMTFKTPSGRIEVYQEQFIDLGEEVLLHKETLQARMDGSIASYPLTLISYKHTHSTHSQHLILERIRDVLPEPRLEISTLDAGRRSIESGDLVRVFNARGSFVIKATVTEAVQPGTIATPQGWWLRDYPEGHPSHLGHTPRQEAHDRVLGETNYPIWDVNCEVEKVSGA